MRVSSPVQQHRRRVFAVARNARMVGRSFGALRQRRRAEASLRLSRLLIACAVATRVGSEPGENRKDREGCAGDQDGACPSSRRRRLEH
eukprot:1886929-Prymnesium_polylepis.3